MCCMSILCHAVPFPAGSYINVSSPEDKLLPCSKIIAVQARIKELFQPNPHIYKLFQPGPKEGRAQCRSEDIILEV